MNRRRAGVLAKSTIVAIVVLLTATSPIPAFAAPKKGWHGLGWDLPALQDTRSVPGTGDQARPVPRAESAERAMTAPPQVRLPRPGRAVVDLAPAAASARTTPVAAGETGLEVGRGRGKAGRAPDGAAAAGRSSGRVEVESVDGARVGFRGPVYRISPVSGDVSGPLAVRLDYSGFAAAYGGDYGQRLRLVSYPDCVLSTPDKPGCRVGTPVEQVNRAGRELVGEVALASATSTMVLAATADTGSGEGDYTATPLSPTGSWSAGGSAGDFSYSYPIKVPAALGGATPGVSLAYSSGSVDGATSATNNQASWVGDGWSLAAGGFIERSYKSCAEDLGGNNGQTKTGDQCWATDNATMALAGRSNQLVKDTANPDVWRPRQEDGSKVERLYGAVNGALDGEHWKITTVDGTQYFFGLNRMPGWVAGNPETQSTFTTTVFGNHGDEPCNATAFADSSCTQAWRWNLDYVVDPRGNITSYYYQPETNAYGRNLNTTTAGTTYTRGGHLLRLEYGLNTNAGGAYAQPAARVLFDTAERCVPGGAVTCDPAQLDDTTATSWPDVPADLICAPGAVCENVSPSFFTRRKLTTITTQVSNGAGGWLDADRWALNHTFPVTGDGGNPPLWLESVTRTGLVGGSASLPPTTFGGTSKSNRTRAHQDYTSLSRYRITTITGELGGVTTVDYTDPDCQAGTPDPATNTTRCYPVYWTPPGATDPVLDWFNKYVVTDVHVDGRTTLGKQTRTHYDYLDGGAWHYDEDFFAKPEHRTWSQWRGYGKVKTTLGNPDDPSGPRTVTETLYLRGMDGDVAPGGGTRSVSVTNSLGESVTDSKQYAGVARETLTYLGDQVIKTVVNDPWSSAATATDVNGVQAFYTANAVSRSRVWLAAANKWRTSRTTTTYDGHGLVTSVQTEGDIDDPSQTSCARTTYAQNTGAWMLNYPDSARTVSGPCADDNPPTSANIISSARKLYDGQAFGAAPTRGDVTEAHTLAEWPAGGAEVYQTPSAKTTYDTVYGRALTTTDALNRTTTISYTPATGSPVTKVVTTSPQVVIAGVPTALTTTEEINPATGLVTGDIDQGGLRTDVTHDPLGRITAVWKPGHSKAANAPADAKFEYAVNTGSPSVVASQRLLASGLYATSYELVDGLGRTVQTQSPTSYAQGGRVVEDVLHDSQGRVWKTHGPYWNSAAPSTSLHVVQDNAVPRTTETRYDSAGRATAVLSLRDGFEQWRTSTTYDGDRVTTVPPLGGTASAVISNGLGQKVMTQQFKDRAHTGPTDPADTTTYTYHRAGQLHTIKDSTGANTWTHEYDLLGRKVSQTDPDSGTSRTTYDAAGQILTTTDARNKTLTFTYDKLGRKTGMFDTTTSGLRLATWVYDSKLKGKPTSSVRFSGGKAYVREVSGYDTAGRPTGTTVVIPTSETGIGGSYSFTVAYDPNSGAVARVSSPGVGGLPAETIYRDYDALGMPTESYATSGSAGTKLVSLTTYNPFGQVLRTNFADADDPKQVSTTHTYDDFTARLTSTLAVRATTTDQYVINRAYTYNQVGDVTEVDDTSTAVPDNQCFGYDYLRRLTSAWTPSSGNCSVAPSVTGLGGPAPYWTDWTYDTTGNRKKQTKHTTAGDTVTEFAYPEPGQPRPHAVTSTTTTNPDGSKSTATYGYNAMGSTEARPGHELRHDQEGRVAVDKDTATDKESTYLYDADGNRLISKEAAGTTLYLVDVELFVPTGSTTATGTRYYTHGGENVARRTAGKLTWTVEDHQGTALRAVDAATLAVTKRYQDPFGVARGPLPGSWPDRHGFIGGVQDPGGTVHLGAREYDPALGRFTSVDPLLDENNPQQWNGYAYADNNPVTLSDPTGLATWMCPDGECGRHGKGGLGYDRSGSNPSTPSEPTLEEQWTAVYSPETDDPNRLISVWYAMYAQRTGFWNNDMGDGHHACFGRKGCQVAWIYLQGPNADVAKAKTIAATYCLENARECAGEDNAEQIVMQMYTDALMNMSGFVGAGVGTRGTRTAPKGGRCVNSFTGDTLVLMADGSTKRIDQIVIGDQVANSEPESEQTETHEVLAVIITDADKDYVDVTVATPDGPKTIHSTAHHPFYEAVGDEWTDAAELEVGDQLNTPGNGRAVIADLRHYKADLRTFNLTIATIHTYYVLAGGTPVLVHNTGPCEVPSVEVLDETWSRTGFPSRSAYGEVVWGGRSLADASKLKTPEQLAKMREIGLTKDDAVHWRNFYQSIHNRSAAKFPDNPERVNPSAKSRADLMQYYVDNL
ncbi:MULTISPECIES: RHS repeat-associated core domain-containing protein [Saccharothrix]|uniref:RHS repeat-associated core domain-containing protein n=1 Tax=Saccharothrix TaxID=2071 RepID=UPI000AAF49F8|nr:RHS repeat-associated core domain-containing protein [Saccharothrix sp. CB00851]